jgi:adenylate cyclase
MTRLHIYLAQDRLRALTRGESLPSRTNGSALFADISGFTALTEALRNALGPRRGAEELTQQIEAVYSALITQIELYGGSVIEFAGDSVLCWFNEDRSLPGEAESGDSSRQPSAAQRAVACGVALQQAMDAFANIVLPDQSTTALTLKVAIASGTARRFVVGDPQIRWIDTLAGATVASTATAEHHARAGEVLIDEFTANLLDNTITIGGWREDLDSVERFAVVGAFVEPIDPPLRMQPDAGHSGAEELHPWVHAALVERERSGQAAFLTEFRPCVAMFVRFGGIDFDQDAAGPQLDAFICQAQRIVARHGGTVIQLTIGDKGSYAYFNFGAFNAHEDDARRAVKTALELQKAARQLGFLPPLQIGITQGTFLVGAYGGHTRKTFGALGDEVNLAARLMTTASPGEILLSSHAHKAVANEFTFEPRSPMPMKGKTEPLPVFAVAGESQKRAVLLQEPKYSLPMVGRQNELQSIHEKLDLALAGKSQIIGIVAEAGMGKSRLAAEVIRSARRKGFVGYGGACQSDSIHTPYLAWKPIWGAFFDVDPDMPLRKQMRNIEGEIEDRAPDRMNAMPLLNAVLDLEIPENDFTQNLEPNIRQSALHALLEDCLRAQAQDEPALIVIEDLHWIDALSHDLLEGMAKALANHAVCFVVAYRPPQLERLQAPRLEALPQFTRIELHELTAAEAESAIRAKLAQLYPARGGALPKGLVDTLTARAQGNPFYLEELLNYVRDRGLDPSDLHRIELPDSLHTLILSRIDQLSEGEKTTLRVASIVGRLFRAGWLTGYYPELGGLPQVKAALDALDALDITPLDSEPELSYLFRHIVTHEVTYESLPFATRARLHEQLARYLESLEASVETISFHYMRTENKEKQRKYLRRAGEAAQKSFANDAALEYYGMLLPLLDDPKEQAEVYLKHGEVLEFLGKYDEAENDYRFALESAKEDAALQASAQFALGKLNIRRGEHESALDWLAQAREARTLLKDGAGLAQVLIETGHVTWRKGEYAKAREPLNEGLALARQAGDRLKMGRALTLLGIVASDQGNNMAARTYYEEGLTLRREVSDQPGIASSLNNLGLLAYTQGDSAAGQSLLEESLALRREIGDKSGVAMCLNNLGLMASSQGGFTAGWALYEESLALSREMGDKWHTAMVLDNLGLVACAQGDYITARALHEESLSLRREIGDKWGMALSLGNLGVLAYAQGDYTTARAQVEESLVLSREISNKNGISYALNNLGFLAMYQGDHAAARASFEESLVLCKEMDEKRLMASALLGLGLLDLAEDKPEARENILHSLHLRQETGERLPQTSNLIGVAVLALRERNTRFAAQLLGAVESALRGLGAVGEPEVLPIHTQTLAAAREQLGESAFQFAREEGAKWSLEEAVQKALEGGDLNTSGE